MKKAVIFDLDGTLADTLESMAYIANLVMEKFGLTPMPVENFKYYCGEGAGMLMRRCLKDAGDPKLAHLEEGERIYREMFAENPMYKVNHYPGMPETIRELKRRGLKLGVCSNKPHPAAVKVIAQMFGDDFDAVMGQSDAIPRKPAPDGALKLAQEFHVQPQECMYVGDTATDMQTGKAAGMFTVGALWGFRDEKELTENGADILAGVPTDLLKILEEVI